MRVLESNFHQRITCSIYGTSDKEAVQAKVDRYVVAQSNIAVDPKRSKRIMAWLRYVLLIAGGLGSGQRKALA
jgi:hypothetical protein